MYLTAFTTMETGRLANSGDKELNDRRIEKVFLMTNRVYRFTFTPKSDFWRIGARFVNDNRGTNMPITHRYNDDHVGHIEVCAGDAPGGKWQNPNVLQLQQYNLIKPSSVLHGKTNYIPRTAVILNLTSISDTKIEVAYGSESTGYHFHTIDIVHKYNFQIYAWADNLEFDIDYEYTVSYMPMTIEIANSKAITGDSLKVPIENLTVLYGKNNSGKTSILTGACKTFISNHDQSADYLAIHRYASVYDYPAACELEDSADAEKRQRDRRHDRCNGTSGIHSVDWAQDIALVPGHIRDKITSFFSGYFEPWEFEQKSKAKYSQTVEAKVNGHPVVEQGTGPLAALPIIIQLFNPLVQFLGIDEPELGLEPRMQKILFKAIKCASEGRDGLPKKRIMIATHSHLFLDRETPDNNYRVEKINGKVCLHRLADREELREATFNLMGCDPTDLFFPANIIMVEGKTDEVFLNAIYTKLLSIGPVKSHNIVFHALGGYDKAPVGVETVVQTFKTSTHTTIYKDKICGIFDFPDKEKNHILAALKKYLGDDAEPRFVHLAKNGIEYYYPLSFASALAGRPVTQDEFDTAVDAYLLAFREDREPTLFGTIWKKGDLAKQVAAHIDDLKDLDEIDQTIKDLISTADRLAFKAVE